MGIYVDFTLRAECPEEELLERIERVRHRCMDLPLRSVGEIRRIEPVYNAVNIDLFEKEGYTLPEAVAERIRPVEDDRDLGRLALSFAPWFDPELPEHQLDRYYAPALELIERTDLWKREDLPEKVEQKLPWGKPVMTLYRHGIEFAFASALLRYGHMMNVDPGEGCETMLLGLSTFARPDRSDSGDPPLWYGQGAVKTQYAKDFVRVHETACRVLDILQEEHLLFDGDDNCGYYASRSWKDASKRVNEELLFAGVMSGMLGAAVGDLREEGVKVQVVEDNASKARPIDFSAELAREEAAERDSESE